MSNPQGSSWLLLQIYEKQGAISMNVHKGLLVFSKKKVARIRVEIFRTYFRGREIRSKYSGRRMTANEIAQKMV